VSQETWPVCAFPLDRAYEVQPTLVDGAPGSNRINQSASPRRPERLKRIRTCPILIRENVSPIFGFSGPCEFREKQIKARFVFRLPLSSSSIGGAAQAFNLYTVPSRWRSPIGDEQGVAKLGLVGLVEKSP